MKIKQRIFISVGLFIIALILLAKHRTITYDQSAVKLSYLQTKLPDIESLVIPPTMNDKFADIQAAVSSDPSKGGYVNYWKVIIDDTAELAKENPTMADVGKMNASNFETILGKFQMGIRKNELYTEDSEIVEELLKSMRESPIKSIVEKEGGTQFKLVVEFENGDKALLKPRRYTRETQTNPNNYYFNDYERFNAEIAAFHLDKVLGLRRCPPVAGRVINITSEIYRLAPKQLQTTFFVSAANNICFHGTCKYYCDTTHAFCGNPDTIEVSLAAYLPAFEEGQRQVWKSPWRRSYMSRRKADWERDGDYCKKIRKISPFDTNQHLLPVLDLAVYDFLMGNLDRHHYEKFQIFGEVSYPIHIDQGRGFGRPFHDEYPILAPVMQCCMIRASTLKTLLEFHTGKKKLSQAMRESMADDAAAPVLWEPNLDALDRRVVVVLQSIRECLKEADAKGEYSNTN